MLRVQPLGDGVVFVPASSTSAKSSFGLARFMVSLFGVQPLFRESLSVWE